MNKDDELSKKNVEIDARKDERAREYAKKINWKKVRARVEREKQKTLKINTIKRKKAKIIKQHKLVSSKEEAIHNVTYGFDKILQSYSMETTVEIIKSVDNYKILELLNKHYKTIIGSNFCNTDSYYYELITYYQALKKQKKVNTQNFIMNNSDDFETSTEAPDTFFGETVLGGIPRDEINSLLAEIKREIIHSTVSIYNAKSTRGTKPIDFLNFHKTCEKLILKDILRKKNKKSASAL